MGQMDHSDGMDSDGTAFGEQLIRWIPQQILKETI